LLAEQGNRPRRRLHRPKSTSSKFRNRTFPSTAKWIGTTDGIGERRHSCSSFRLLIKEGFTLKGRGERGAVAFEIDPRPFQAVLNQTKGDLAKFVSQVQQAITQVDQAQAQLSQANSQLAQAEANQLKTQLDVNKFRRSSSKSGNTAGL